LKGDSHEKTGGVIVQASILIAVLGVSMVTQGLADMRQLFSAADNLTPHRLNQPGGGAAGRFKPGGR
jgi:hypothetical protein